MVVREDTCLCENMRLRQAIDEETSSMVERTVQSPSIESTRLSASDAAITSSRSSNTLR